MYHLVDLWVNRKTLRLNIDELVDLKSAIVKYTPRQAYIAERMVVEWKEPSAGGGGGGTHWSRATPERRAPWREGWS